MELMETAKIFNPDGNDDVLHRQLWFGNVTNLIQLNDIKYNWAIGLYNQMKEQFWIPEKVDLSQDINQYRYDLTQSEIKAYDGILSYLTFLDSIQTCMLPAIKSPMTAPEVKLCVTSQGFQESIHNQAYQVMLEAIIPSSKRNYVYDFWRTDKVLFDRCKYIASLYQQYIDNKTQENYFTALIADYILEGLYFYNGFAWFYNLASRLLMGGSADMIKYINKDELSHVRLFSRIVIEAMKMLPYSEEKIYQMFDEAVQNEIKWTNHITNNDILGIREETTDIYTKYLANNRLKAIGLKPLYLDSKYKTNPYAHLERFADLSKDGNVKANFFDGTVTSYSMSSAVDGWNNI